MNLILTTTQILHIPVALDRLAAFSPCNLSIPIPEMISLPEASALCKQAKVSHTQHRYLTTIKKFRDRIRHKQTPLSQCPKSTHVEVKISFPARTPRYFVQLPPLLSQPKTPLSNPIISTLASISTSLNKLYSHLKRPLHYHILAHLYTALNHSVSPLDSFRLSKKLPAPPLFSFSSPNLKRKALTVYPSLSQCRPVEISPGARSLVPKSPCMHAKVDPPTRVRIWITDVSEG